MSNRIRYLIQEKITEKLKISKWAVLSHLRIQRDVPSNQFFFEFPLKSKSFTLNNEHNNILEIFSEKEEFNNLLNDACIQQKRQTDYLHINFNRNSFIKEFLESNVDKVSAPQLISKSKHVVVEFSSPNIAKPFHVGHLRSTIIGNYIANLLKYLNNNVVKINYLGDWGTQLGLMKLGMDLLNITNEDLKSNPLRILHQVYVHANKLVEADREVFVAARKMFQEMEQNDTNYLEQNELLKQHTVQELDNIYTRLGVKFDEYHWESKYSLNRTQDVLASMHKLGLLTKDSSGRRVVDYDGNRSIPIIKSDGSTLYLYRDIAAAIDRANTYKFDEMYYVVDISQQDHFQCLFHILKKMEVPAANKLHHIKFGKIHGMSTRKGTVIFLTDILDEANRILKEKQRQSSNTKVILNSDDDSSDVLGLSAIIIHDLKQRRMRDYHFSWDMALDMRGETGIKLQYTHCRLCNVEENCNAVIAKECDPDVLKEPIVDELITIMSQFDEAIISSYGNLEACYLTKYLFHLSHIINKSLEQLQVKGQPADIASQRLLLLRVAKNILNTGMKLLCLTPLSKM